MFIEMLRSQIAALTTTRDAALARMDEIAATITADETRSEADDAEAEELTKLEDEARTANDSIAEKAAKLAELEAIRDAQEPTSSAPAEARSQRRSGGDDPFDIELRNAPRTDEVRRDIRNRAMRAVEQAEDLNDEQRGQVDKLIRDPKVNRGGALERHIIATGRPAYRSAWSKLMRDVKHFTPEESAALEEVRAINITTDSEGGYLMPYTLDPTIVLVNAGRTNPMRQLATVRSVTTDNWHGVTTGGVTASWDAESEEVSDDSPTFSPTTLDVKEGRAFVPYTVESEEDFAGLVSDVTMLVGDAFDALEASGFATGTGTGKEPQGIITGLVAASSTVTTASAGTLALGDLEAASDAIPDRYDSAAVWLVHRGIITAIRNLASTNDPYSFLTNGDVPKLLDRARYKYSALDGEVATGKNIAVVGDIQSCYRIHDRIGVTMERVPHLFGTNGRPTGERGFFARKRVGAGVVNASAARVLVVG